MEGSTINNNSSDVEKLNQLVEKTQLLKKEIAKVIIGQEEIVEQVLISICS